MEASHGNHAAEAGKAWRWRDSVSGHPQDLVGVERAGRACRGRALVLGTVIERAEEIRRMWAGEVERWRGERI